MSYSFVEAVTGRLNGRFGDRAIVKLDGRDITDSVVWVEKRTGHIRRQEIRGKKRRIDLNDPRGTIATYLQAVAPERLDVEVLALGGA